MAQAVEEWYKQMPIITRSYLTAAIVTTIGCSLDVIPCSIASRLNCYACVDIVEFLYLRKSIYVLSKTLLVFVSLEEFMEMDFLII